MQSQIFHKHVEFTLQFPLRINSPYQNLFLYFPEFFLRWHMYSIFLINNLYLSRSWTKFMNPISCLPFLYVPCHFMMYGEKFISQWNYLNLWRLLYVFLYRKFSLRKKSTSGKPALERLVRIWTCSVSILALYMLNYKKLLPPPLSEIKILLLLSDIVFLNQWILKSTTRVSFLVWNVKDQ